MINFEEGEIVLTGNENQTETEESLLSAEASKVADTENTETGESSETVSDIDYSQTLSDIYNILDETKSIVFMICCVVIIDFVFKHIKGYFHL